MNKVWRALFLVSQAALCACGTPKPAEQAQGNPKSAAPALSKTPPAPPSAGPTPKPEPAPVAKVPPRESTPGKIQCETLDCDLATEVCCVAQKNDGTNVGRCVAKPPGPDNGESPCCPPNRGGFCGNSERTLERRCDEAADCPSAGHCCALGAGEGDLARETCDSRCFTEKCLAGSTCPNGNRCTASGEEVAGECPLQTKPPKCGKATCNAGEVCCFNPETKAARCAESCEEGVDVTLACTSPDQCAPHDCNAYAGQAPAKYVCGGEGFMGRVLCRTLKDCPKQLSSLGYGPQSPTAHACVSSPALPPGVKECEYE